MFARYGDQRNAWAAGALRKLADDMANLPDEAFARLGTHCDDSERWREAISEAARQVGFRHKSKSLPFFLKNLIGVLSQPAVVN